MESSYSTSPCTRGCENRCVEPNWRKNVDRQRETVTEYRANVGAKKNRVQQTKKAAGLYR
jgi:hypothetical protein